MTIKIKRLDHHGIVAGVIDDLSVVGNQGVKTLEKVLIDSPLTQCDLAILLRPDVCPDRSNPTIPEFQNFRFPPPHPEWKPYDANHRPDRVALAEKTTDSAPECATAAKFRLPGDSITPPKILPEVVTAEKSGISVNVVG